MKLLPSVLVCLLFMQNAFCSPPPGYYNAAIGKDGYELRSALHLIISGHSVIPYSGGTNNTADALEVLDQDPADTNSVYLLYAQKSEPKSLFAATNGWNREHVWPNSYGLDDKPPAYTDLFNLRAEDSNVNSARGNKFFDNSSTNESSFRVPGHAEAPFTSTDFNSWEPPANAKGDIARILFYMDVRYEGTRTNEQNLILTDNLSWIHSSNAYMGRLSTILRWHAEDPVDDAERGRNDLIYNRYQHNRNPFVDHPEWVGLIFKPVIQFSLLENSIRLSWPIEFPDAIVLSSTNLHDGWLAASSTRTTNVSDFVLEEPVSAGDRFYKLELK